MTKEYLINTLWVTRAHPVIKVNALDCLFNCIKEDGSIDNAIIIEQFNQIVSEEDTNEFNKMYL